MKFYMQDYPMLYLSGPVLRDSSTQVEDNTNGLWDSVKNDHDCLMDMNS